MRDRQQRLAGDPVADQRQTSGAGGNVAQDGRHRACEGTLSCERRQRAAIGEVAGRLFDPEHLTQPRAVLAIAGKADTTDPFTLQQQTIENDDRPADSATGPGQQCPVPSGAASGTKCTFYTSTTHTPVKTLIHPGAHVYPPWAPEEIVTFFKAHKHP